MKEFTMTSASVLVDVFIFNVLIFDSLSTRTAREIFYSQLQSILRWELDTLELSWKKKSKKTVEKFFNLFSHYTVDRRCLFQVLYFLNSNIFKLIHVHVISQSIDCYLLCWSSSDLEPLLALRTRQNCTYRIICGPPRAIRLVRSALLHA